MTMRALIPLSALLLSGCINTVGSVVTAPFKAVGQAADWTTTSQDEADRNRGRMIRKAEERARKECKRDVEGDLAREDCVRERLRDKGIT